MEMVDTYQRFSTFLEDLTTVTADDVWRVARTYLVETNRTVGWFVPSGPVDESRPGVES
jgi:zinc protease